MVETNITAKTLRDPHINDPRRVKIINRFAPSNFSDRIIINPFSGAVCLEDLEFPNIKDAIINIGNNESAQIVTNSIAVVEAIAKKYLLTIDFNKTVTKPINFAEIRNVLTKGISRYGGSMILGALLLERELERVILTKLLDYISSAQTLDSKKIEMLKKYLSPEIMRVQPYYQITQPSKIQERDKKLEFYRKMIGLTLEEGDDGNLTKFFNTHKPLFTVPIGIPDKAPGKIGFNI